MGDWAVGPIAPGEVEASIVLDERAFGSRMSPALRAAIIEHSEPDRTIATRDGGELASVAVSIPTTLTLPGLVRAPVAAVVGVAVPPTHRRQGRLRSMMRYQLDDLLSRGEDLATLTSSEAPIYQRFGYGPATLASWYSVETRGLEVRPPPTGERLSAPGQVRFVDRDRALSGFPAVLDAAQALRAGEVGAFGVRWVELCGSSGADEQRERFFVEYHEGDEVLGYAVYRIDVTVEDRPKRVVKLDEIATVTPEAYRSLWSFLVDIDLVHRVETGGRPVDEAIRWALSDYRRMSVRWTSEHTFVRLVDVAGALGRRRYFRPGSVTLSVRDPFCAWNTGSYRLVVAEDGSGSVERSHGDGARPDLELEVSTLASVYLGGVRPSSLALIGLVEERRAGALAEVEAMFCGPEPPFCTTSF